MDFELQGKPHSKGSAGSSGSNVMNIHDDPRHTSFLSLSNSVDYSSYYKLRPPEVIVVWLKLTVILFNYNYKF